MGGTRSRVRWQEERTFGFTLAIVLGLADGLWWYRAYTSAAAARLDDAAHHATVAGVLSLVALAMAALAVAFPRVLWPLRKAWMQLGLALHAVTSRVMLAAIYYLLVTPIGLVFRLRGTDPLDRRLEPERESYWQPRPRGGVDPAQYEKQY